MLTILVWYFLWNTKCLFIALVSLYLFLPFTLPPHSSPPLPLSALLNPWLPFLPSLFFLHLTRSAASRPIWSFDASAGSLRCLQSCARSRHSAGFSTCSNSISLSMLSLHLMHGLPTVLVPSSIPVSSPLIVLSFSILATCPAHLLNLTILSSTTSSSASASFPTSTDF